MAKPIDDGGSPLSTPPESLIDPNEETSAQFSPTNSHDEIQPLKRIEELESKSDTPHKPKPCESIEEELESGAPRKSKLLERIEELKMPSDDDMGAEDAPYKSNLLERLEELEKPSDDDMDADELAEEDETRDSITAKPDQKRTARSFRAPSRQKASAHVEKASPKNNRRIVLTNRRKSAKQKKWKAPGVYTDPKSPLANADLRVNLSFGFT